MHGHTPLQPLSDYPTDFHRHGSIDLRGHEELLFADSLMNGMGGGHIAGAQDDTLAVSSRLYLWSFSSWCILLAAQYITDAPNRMDQLRGKAFVDFFPKITDVNVDHVGAAFIVEIPQVVFDLFPGKDQTLISDQVFQQGKFTSGQTDVSAAAGDLAGRGIQGQICQPVNAAGGWADC